MKLNFVPLLIILFVHSFAFAEIDAKKLAPLTVDQVHSLLEEAKTLTKAQKWNMVQAVVTLELKKSDVIHSEKLPGTVHALSIDYGEKQMHSDVTGKTVDAQGDLLRSIVGIQLKSDFKILKDGGYYQGDCGDRYTEYSALEPITLNQKSLLAIEETTHTPGCVNTDDFKDQTLLLLDPSQNYAQVASVPFLKKKNKEVLMSASYSVNKDTLLDIKRETLAQGKKKTAHDHYEWNKAQTQLELK